MTYEENYVILKPDPCHLVSPGVQDGTRISLVILEPKYFVIVEPVVFKYKKKSASVVCTSGNPVRKNYFDLIIFRAFCASKN